MKKRDWRHWNVAVTGMNARPDNPGPGYAVARCLRESSHFQGRLTGLGYDSLDPGLYHPALDGGYLLPYPALGEEALLARILEIHRENRLDAIIPCLDAELVSFIKAAPALAKAGIHTLLPTREMVQARSKDRLVQLCARVGVSTPATRAITDPGYFDNAVYPLVIKGIFYDAAVVRSASEARVAFARMAQQWGYPILVQQYLPGQEFNLTALGDGRGGLLAPVSMRKKALTEKGKAWAGMAVHDEALEEMAAALVAGLNWLGPLEVEALRGDDGSLHLIEINPRFPAWTYFTQGVGRNLPEALLRLMSGEKLPSFPPTQAGKLFIRYAEELIVDLESFESVLMQGESPAGDSTWPPCRATAPRHQYC